MLVIVPTYKRLDCLKCVIYSILENQIPETDDGPRLAIVNNFPPNASDVARQVDEICRKKPYRSLWEITILNREKSLPPAENWYRALEELARPGEVVFFVGDDDPLTSWSLRCRCDALTSAGASFVLAKISHGLFFHDNGEKVLFLGESPIEKEHSLVSVVDYCSLWNWTAIHLSNHCFKYDATFKRAYKVALEFCEDQNFVNKQDRQLFITFYIPLAMILLGAKVIGIDQVVVYRGKSTMEARTSKYGVSSWNLGFICLMAHDVLRTRFKSIECLNKLADHFKGIYRSWYIPTLFDPRVKKCERILLEKRVGFSRSELTFRDYRMGLGILLKDFLKINGIFLTLRALFKSKKIEDSIIGG